MIEVEMEERGVRLMHKLFQTAQRIGENLQIEATESGLRFRTLNTSRSAFCAVRFKAGFFRSYAFREREAVRVQLLLRPCLGVFKGAHSMETLTFRIDVLKSRVVFDVRSKSGLGRTYKFAYEECEVLQVVFDRSMCTTSVAAPYTLIAEALHKFRGSPVEEVTISATPDRFTMRSYFDATRGDVATKSFATEANIGPKDFTVYDLPDGDAEPYNVTVCLKELRAAFAFGEFAQVVTLSYDCPGKPVLIEVPVDANCEAHFVHATLVDALPDASQVQPSAPAPAPAPRPRPRPRPTPPAVSPRKRIPDSDPDHPALPSPQRHRSRDRDGDVVMADPAGAASNTADAANNNNNNDDDDDDDDDNDDDEMAVDATPPPSESREGSRRFRLLGTQTYTAVDHNPPGYSDSEDDRDDDQA